MSINHISEALIKSLEDSAVLANDLAMSVKTANVPVSIEELGGQIKEIIDNHDLSLDLIAAQAGVSKNSIYRAMRDPMTMRLETLQSVINPLGLTLCFAKR
jgi:DNA-binding phage protein